MFYLLGAYLLWSAATVVWSDDITLSIRRFGQMILILIGTFGLGAGFYTRTREGTLTLGRHVLYGSWIAVAMLITSRLPSGGLSELTNPEWTLKENTAWQFYVFPVAYGLIAALVIFHRSAKVKIALSVTLLSLVLVLLKGRTMIAGTLAAALILVSALAKRGFARTAALSIGGLLSLGQLDLAAGGWMFLSCASFIVDKFPAALPFITVGNGVNDLLTLDGRIPLWQALWAYFEEHPIIGHGFGAFWNPSRFDTIYYDAGWTAVVAHNGFFEELLGTGIIGLLLFLVFWFRGLWFTTHLTSPDRRAGYLVLGWGLLFLYVNSTGSILQFYFQAPALFSFTALFALAGSPTNDIRGHGVTTLSR